ncbi:hypothetical protein C0989_009209 [Termitomyces sp. Mn162]|nr:hypothetical protein C0989_009209 [Termitomyces sp. Mn162]
MSHKPQEVLDLIGVASGVHCRGAGVGRGLGAESAGRGAEDLDIGGGKLRAVCGAGGASAEWAEGGGILGSRLWEVESFPAIGGGAQQEAAGVRADGGFSGVSRSLSYPGRGLGMGIKFSRAPAFDHGGLPLQAGGGANSGVDGMGGGALAGKGGSRCGAGREGGVGVGMEHLGAGGAGASAGGIGFAGASDTAGGAAHGGGRGAGDGARGWSAMGGVGGSKAEGGLAGQRGRFRACRNSLLGVGALDSLGWCLCSVCIDSRRVGADAHGSASGVAAGDGKGGEVAGRASAA